MPPLESKRRVSVPLGYNERMKSFSAEPVVPRCREHIRVREAFPEALCQAAGKA